jgi:hypothetical protein
MVSFGLDSWVLGGSPGGPWPGGPAGARFGRFRGFPGILNLFNFWGVGNDYFRTFQRKLIAR